MQYLVSVLSRAAVSLPALLLLNILVAIVNFRLILQSLYIHFGSGDFDLMEYSYYASAAAVRMITVGVLILERHDILEFAGLIEKGAPHDEISEKSHPYGTYYLCFGLVMECIVEQLHIPWGWLSPAANTQVIVYSSAVIAAIGLLGNLSLFKIFAELAMQRKADFAPASAHD